MRFTVRNVEVYCYKNLRFTVSNIWAPTGVNNPREKSEQEQVSLYLKVLSIVGESRVYSEVQGIAGIKESTQHQRAKPRGNPGSREGYLIIEGAYKLRENHGKKALVGVLLYVGFAVGDVD